jgi:DNA-3-methyladenine glycosylase
LFKSALPWFDDVSPRDATLALMQRLNPARDGSARAPERLCAGQTLLCRSLDLRIGEWNGRSFERERFYLDDVGYRPTRVVQARRLGIAVGRDEHLPWRFVDADHAHQCTANPLSKRAWRVGRDYWLLGPRDRIVRQERATSSPDGRTH